MKQLIRSITAGTLLTLGAVSAANASTITATFSGTFATGQTDNYGHLTGTSGTDIGGTAFTGTVSYGPYSEVEAFSGYSIGGSGSGLDLAITTNGHTVDFNSPVQIIETRSGSGTDVIFDASRPNHRITANLFTTTAYTSTQLQTQAGLDAYLAGMTSWSGTSDYFFVSDDWGQTQAINFTITQAGTAAAVPEPESLSLIGLGLLGLLARRRRKQ